MERGWGLAVLEVRDGEAGIGGTVGRLSSSPRSGSLWKENGWRTSSELPVRGSSQLLKAFIDEEPSHFPKTFAMFSLLFHISRSPLMPCSSCSKAFHIPFRMSNKSASAVTDPSPETCLLKMLRNPQCAASSSLSCKSLPTVPSSPILFHTLHHPIIVNLLLAWKRRNSIPTRVTFVSVREFSKTAKGPDMILVTNTFQNAVDRSNVKRQCGHSQAFCKTPFQQSPHHQTVRSTILVAFLSRLLSVSDASARPFSWEPGP